MPNIKTEIQDQQLTAALNRLLAAGERPDSILDAIGRQIKTNVLLGFHTGTDPYGVPWAPLKIREGRPLRDQDHLMNSIDYRIEGNSVEIGTNKPYSITHQKGAKITPKHGKALVFPGPGGKLIFARSVTIPPRRIFPLEGLPEPWREDVLDVIRPEIVGAWNGEQSA